MKIIVRLAGFVNWLLWDSSKPNDQFRRKLDVSKTERYFGFKSRTPFEEGLRRAIEWYQTSLARHDTPSLAQQVQAA